MGSRLFTATSSQYVERAASPVSNYPFSVAGWFKATSNNPSATQGIFYLGNSGSSSGYTNVTVDNTGGISAWERSAGASKRIIGAIDYADGAWHSFVLVVEAGQLTLYVDNAAGVVVVATGTNGIALYNRVGWGGILAATRSNFFNGRVCRGMMFSRIVTSAEATEFRNTGDIADRTSCVADWDMTSGESPEVDDSGNGYDLTVTGATFDADEPAFTTIVGITRPSAYQVIQRSGTAGNIPIEGTYSGAIVPTSIEARWNGGSWTTIDAAPAAGVYSGTLPSQPQGQGALEVRFGNSTGITASKSFVGIGDIFACLGQSNMSGQGTNNQTYSHPTLKAALFGNDYQWQELADPYDSSIGQIDGVSVGSAGGSVTPHLATLLMDRLGVPVAFIPCAKASTAITAWQPGANHLDRTTLYGSANYRVQQAGARLALYWQGESDASAGASQATYNAALDSLANAWLADTGTKLMPCKLQTCTDVDVKAGLPAINAAIVEAWGDNPSVLTGPDLSGISVALHLITNAELTAAAGLWADAIEAAIAGTADAPPTITSATTKSGQVGVALSYTITATGTAPITFGASGLPAGLSVNTSTGAITGTPATEGVTASTITATNSAGAVSETLTFTIAAAPTPGPTSGNLSLFNQLAEAVGAAGGHRYNLDALNAISQQLTGSAGHTRNLAALNAIAGFYIGSTQSFTLNIDALNAITGKLGGASNNTRTVDALAGWLGKL